MDGAPNSPDPSLALFLSLSPPAGGRSSSSVAFKSSSISHTGLGGRLRTGGGPISADGSGELSFRSSSMSHIGLGARAGRAGGGRGGVGARGAFQSPPTSTSTSTSKSKSKSGASSAVARPFPLAEVVAASDCWDARRASWVLMGRALVLLLRNGLLNASCMRLAFTWPKPGRFCSCSEDARAMAVKLCDRPRGSGVRALRANSTRNRRHSLRTTCGAFQHRSY